MNVDIKLTTELSDDYDEFIVHITKLGEPPLLREHVCARAAVQETPSERIGRPGLWERLRGLRGSP